MVSKAVALLPAPVSESELILRESPLAASMPGDQLQEMAAAGGRSIRDPERISQLRQRFHLWVTQGVMV